MHIRATARTITALACAAVVLGACGSSAPHASTTGSTRVPGGAATTGMSGPLVVFAAASLTGALTSARSTLTSGNPGLSLTFNFGGSNTLATQIAQGAPADVFASADEKNMSALVAAGLVETPVVFARNKLEIAVAPGNPKRITGLADLARPDVSVVLEAPGVPAGDYTRQVLASQHINVAPRSLETDVKAALAKVTSGEADATVVYVTDVEAAGARVAGVGVPDPLQPRITYPIAVVAKAPHRAAAEAFLRSAVSGDVQRALEASGFLAPQ